METHLCNIKGNATEWCHVTSLQFILDVAATWNQVNINQKQNFLESYEKTYYILYILICV